MKPARNEIKHAVYYAVAAISGRSLVDLEEEMVLGGKWRTGVGMDQTAIDAVASMLNLWIKHRGGKGRIGSGDLAEDTTLGDTIDTVSKQFD